MRCGSRISGDEGCARGVVEPRDEIWMLETRADYAPSEVKSS
jgi:hypothetical protein